MECGESEFGEGRGKRGEGGDGDGLLHVDSYRVMGKVRWEGRVEEGAMVCVVYEIGKARR
jgi:hypothetical protein